MKTLSDFIKVRSAFADDDSLLVRFLLRCKRDRESQCAELLTTKREIELCSVESRRITQFVRIAEIGSRIVGTYTLTSDGGVEFLAAESSEIHGEILRALLADAVVQATRRKMASLHISLGVSPLNSSAQALFEVGFLVDQRQPAALLRKALTESCLI